MKQDQHISTFSYKGAEGKISNVGLLRQLYNDDSGRFLNPTKQPDIERAVVTPGSELRTSEGALMWGNCASSCLTCSVHEIVFTSIYFGGRISTTKPNQQINIV